MVFRTDGTMVLLHQIFGNGQADAVSAFILVVGFVFPVKAFKESGIIDIFTCRIVVGHGKTYAGVCGLFGKRDPDGAAGITVFDGVVYKQGNESAGSVPLPRTWRGRPEFRPLLFCRPARQPGQRYGWSPVLPC